MVSFKHAKINSIVIDEEYSLTRNKTLIRIDENSNVTINIKVLSKIRNISNLESIKTILEYYPVLRSLNVSGCVDYHKILSPLKSKEYTKYLIDKIKSTLALITDYHTKIFPIRKKCYSNLKNVIFNGDILELPVYNHEGVTGRTSITKGYNFLTMKKLDRKLIQPLSKDNILVEVDFKSCEPFFYLLAKNFNLESVTDVYQWISENYNVEINDRNKFKRGILSMIYGANENTISRIMQTSLKNVKRIKSELGLNKLFDQLTQEFDEKGHILNYYGRPITSNSNLVNYWIQSSAVDYCSLAFYQFCNEFNLSPCFFVHDSMTFEIPKERYDEISEIKTISENISGITIPVEFSKY